MADKYLTLSQFYNQGTVVKVKLDVDIKKAQGDSSYKGYSIAYEDKTSEEIETIKIASSWLHNDWQKDLLNMIKSLEPGDEFTAYKEKTIKESDHKAIIEEGDEDKIKKAGYWGVKAIYKGFVVPDQMDDSGSAKAGPKRSGGGKTDIRHIVFGNALNVAMKMKPKATPLAEIVEFAKAEVYPAAVALTATLKDEYPDLDDYTLGARQGQYLLVAAEKAKTIPRLVEGVGLLFELVDAAEQELFNPSKEEEKEEPADEEQPDLDDEDDEDDIPF